MTYGWKTLQTAGLNDNYYSCQYFGECGVRCFNASGGETIRDINRVSGAHVELDRNSGNNPMERLFRIRGSPEQIQHAIQLINEKTGAVSKIAVHLIIDYYMLVHAHMCVCVCVL